MRNYLLFFIGFIVSLVIAFIPAFHEAAFVSHILYGVFAAFVFYYCTFKKLDFNDNKLYLACFLYFLATFAFADMLSFGGINLLLYICVYLFSSIPFGFVLAKVFADVDIKTLGSNSIGATNVLRVVKEKDKVLAKKLAFATFALDFLKAFLPILCAKFAGFDDNVLWSIGVFAVVGHCFSFYLSLEGGKGVATGAGVMAVLLPLELLIALCVWFVCIKLFKISSLASLLAALVFITSSFIIHYDMSINTHAPVILICLIVFYKHIPNIKRMIFKEENKFV